jgi:hypothetical protein
MGLLGPITSPSEGNSPSDWEIEWRQLSSLFLFFFVYSKEVRTVLISVVVVAYLYQSQYHLHVQASFHDGPEGFPFSRGLNGLGDRSGVRVDRGVVGHCWVVGGCPYRWHASACPWKRPRRDPGVQPRNRVRVSRPIELNNMLVLFD